MRFRLTLAVLAAWAALLLSYVLLREEPQWIHLFGLALVLAGLFAIIRAERTAQN